ncbi:hypothetical protein GCM10009540_44710 [Streptomyces turgidiscabies]
MRSPGRGASGSDWVLPGTAGAAAATGAAGAAVAGRVSAGLAETEAVAEAGVVGRVNGSARAVAHATPMEEERYPRMPLILDIVIHTCPTMN